MNRSREQIDFRSVAQNCICTWLGDICFVLRTSQVKLVLALSHWGA